MPFVCRMQQLFESDSRERAQGRGSADPTEGGGGGYGGYQAHCTCVVDEDARDPTVEVQRHVSLFGMICLKPAMHAVRRPMNR